MAVWQLPNGRWAVKVWIGGRTGRQVFLTNDPITREPIKDKEHGLIIQGDILAQRRAAREETGDEDADPDTLMTFAELAALFWERHVVKKKLPYKTRQYFADQLDQRIIGRPDLSKKKRIDKQAAERRERQRVWLGDMPVNNIRPRVIDKWMADMERAGHGARSINAAVEVVRLILSKGIRWEIVTRANAASGFEPVRETPKEAMIYTVEELVRVGSRMPTDMDRALLFTLAFTGLRIGTVLSFRRNRINLETGMVRFYSSKGKRWITAPMDPRLVRCLDWWMAQHNQAIIFHRAKDKKKQISQDWWRLRRFKPAMHAEGFLHAFIHELRHTGITRFIGLGFTAKQVGDMVDQSSEWITMQYAKDFDQHRSVAVERLRAGADFD